eukprot:1287134-Amphidinium_carterae.1
MSIISDCGCCGAITPTLGILSSPRGLRWESTLRNKLEFLLNLMLQRGLVQCPLEHGVLTAGAPSAHDHENPCFLPRAKMIATAKISLIAARMCVVFERWGGIQFLSAGSPFKAFQVFLGVSQQIDDSILRQHLCT